MHWLDQHQVLANAVGAVIGVALIALGLILGGVSLFVFGGIGLLLIIITVGTWAI